MRQYTTHRSGFTLVELLVAAALTILIMSILASAFQTAMDSMSHLRAAAEMQDRLRAADVRLRSDLLSPHLDDEGVPNGRVSNVRFDRNASLLPQAGFFRIDQSAAAAVEFTTTVVGAPRDYSSVARGTENHRLMFTARLSGKTRQSLFTAPRVPGAAGMQGLDGRNDNLVQDALSYGSRWAIVTWFLALSGENTKGPNPQPLYTLHRRIKLLAEVPDCHIDPTNPNAIHYFHDHRQTVNGLPNPRYGHVFTPKDVEVASAMPASVQTPPLCSAACTRPYDLPAATVPPRPFASVAFYDMYLPVGDGSDIVLSNVASFEIKADYSQQFVSLPGPIVTMYPRPAADPTSPLLATIGISAVATNGFNQDFPFDDLPKNPLLAATATPNLRSFDTGLPGGTGLLNLLGSPPQQYRVKGLQVKLRIYDPKTMGTRQVTIIQEM